MGLIIYKYLKNKKVEDIYIVNRYGEGIQLSDGYYRNWSFLVHNLKRVSNINIKSDKLWINKNRDYLVYKSTSGLRIITKNNIYPSPTRIRHYFKIRGSEYPFEEDWSLEVDCNSKYPLFVYEDRSDKGVNSILSKVDKIENITLKWR